MSRIAVIVFVVLFLNAYHATGQQARKKDADKKAAAHKNVLLPQIYFGNSDYVGGPVAVAKMADLLKSGFTSHDSSGKKYKVVGFEFGYAERNLYEDSIGNLQILVDYLSEFCIGDTISAGVASSIYDRIKPGDTLTVEKVQLLKMNGDSVVGSRNDAFLGKGLKCFITK